MGRVFLSAGHGGTQGGNYDPGIIAGGITEAQQMIVLRDQLIPELRNRGLEVLSVPDDLGLQGTIDWINGRAKPQDVALEIHGDAFTDPQVRGATAYYIANNEERKRQGESLLLALVRRFPQLPNRGAKPDTNTATGQLAFCRQVVLPSLVLNVGFLTNPDDRDLMVNQSRAMAAAIAEGLTQWSNEITGKVATPTTTVSYPLIGITLNRQKYPEQGILVNGNSFIPIDIADRLGVDLVNANDVRLFQHQGVVYAKAIDLRPYNIAVTWDAETRSVVLTSILKICSSVIDRIMGHGNTTPVQMMMFLKANNEAATRQFPDIAQIYREEGEIEGVNYDIAFAQMCMETGFLQFGGDIGANQNNFASLGGIGGASASFPNVREGVRAHIQHLKAYGSLEPLVQNLIDPRFLYVTRGIAPLVSLLSGRWAADLQYGDRIMAMVRRLYETSGLL